MNRSILLKGIFATSLALISVACGGTEDVNQAEPNASISTALTTGYCGVARTKAGKIYTGRCVTNACAQNTPYSAACPEDQIFSGTAVFCGSNPLGYDINLPCSY